MIFKVLPFVSFLSVFMELLSPLFTKVLYPRSVSNTLILFIISPTTLPFILVSAVKYMSLSGTYRVFLSHFRLALTLFFMFWESSFDNSSKVGPTLISNWPISINSAIIALSASLQSCSINFLNYLKSEPSIENLRLLDAFNSAITEIKVLFAF